jgi:hypothetical protein
VEATLAGMSHGALLSRMQVYHASSATVFQKSEQLREQRSAVSSTLMMRAMDVRAVILMITSVHVDGVPKLHKVPFRSGTLMSMISVRMSTMKTMMLTNS